jgi:hypothetical protein
MTDIHSQAAKEFYKLVRTFAERTKPWQTAIFYDVKPDEKFDTSLVSRRVYGRRDEFLAVMAAAGLDHPDQELKQQQLILPTDAQLFQMKRRAGFESLSEYREYQKPTWIEI